jgi:hypothetical protein
MAWLAPLVGGAVSAIGSIYGAQQNAQAQEQVNAENLAYQKEFAQNDIQWKVADAKAAGINPLAALGAQEQSFSNLVAPQPGAGFSSAGQSLGRAISALQTPEQRDNQAAATALDLQSKQLNNQYIAAKINEINNPSAPGQPTAGRAAQLPGKMNSEFEENPVALYAWAPRSDGTIILGPSRATEGWSWNSYAAKAQYEYRTNVEQNLFPGSKLYEWANAKSATGPAGPGEVWKFDPVIGGLRKIRVGVTPETGQSWTPQMDQTVGGGQ